MVEPVPDRDLQAPGKPSGRRPEEAPVQLKLISLPHVRGAAFYGLLVSTLLHVALLFLLSHLWERSVYPPIDVAFAPGAPARGPSPEMPGGRGSLALPPAAGLFIEKPGGGGLPAEALARLERMPLSAGGLGIAPLPTGVRIAEVEGDSSRWMSSFRRRLEEIGRRIEEGRGAGGRGRRGAMPVPLAGEDQTPPPSPVAGSPTLFVAPSGTLDLISLKDLANSVERYRSVIIPGASEKRETAGFLKLAPVRFRGGDPSPAPLEHLAEYMRTHTQILTRIDGQAIELADRRLMAQPFVYMTGALGATASTVGLSNIAQRQLAAYLTNGGFLYLEDNSVRAGGGEVGSDAATTVSSAAGVTPFWTQATAILREALGTQARFVKLPKTHPIYHSFYDFYDGPPLTDPVRGRNDLYGIEIDGRLAAVLSNLGISSYWTQPTGERMLQFGVNVVVYALTQPGGLAAEWGSRVYGVSRDLRPGAEASLSRRDSGTDTAAVVFLPAGGNQAELRPSWIIEFGGRVILPPTNSEPAKHGLALTGIPPSIPYVITVTVGKKKRTVTYAPPGGSVTTFWVGLELIFGRERVAVRQDRRLESYSRWRQHSSGTGIVEVAWRGDSDGPGD